MLLLLMMMIFSQSIIVQNLDYCGVTVYKCHLMLIGQFMFLINEDNQV